MPTPYTDLERVKAELQRQADGSDYNAEDSLLQSDIDDATRLIDDHTKRTFAETAVTTRLIDCIQPYVMGPFLTLKDDIWKITAVTNGDGTAVPLTDLTAEPRNYTRSGGAMIIPSTRSDAYPFWQLQFKHSTGSYWTFNDSPEEAISITGVWGFSETPPEAIVRSATSLAVHLYRLRHISVDGGYVTSRDGQLLVPNAIPGPIQEWLQHYVKVL